MKAVEITEGPVCLIDFGFDLRCLPDCEGCTAIAVVWFSSASHFRGDYPVFTTYLILGHSVGGAGSLSSGTKLEGADVHLTHSIPTASSPPPRRVQRGSQVADYSSTPDSLC